MTLLIGNLADREFCIWHFATMPVQWAVLRRWRLTGLPEPTPETTRLTPSGHLVYRPLRVGRQRPMNFRTPERRLRW